MNKLYTTREVAKLLGVSVQAVHKIAHEIGPIKIGRGFRFREVDVESWLARRAAKAQRTNVLEIGPWLGSKQEKSPASGNICLLGGRQAVNEQN